ncbi:MAG: hypothetical protein KA174_04675 [Chitinophagales bacterium]|nr:hypothetical protein [Saprospirales bacterium]MBP6659952.1 hypothetical protein [Chitinophagales bacterium]
MKKILILYFISVINFLAFGQNQITKPNPKLYFNTKYVTLDNPKLRNPDTITENFHRHNITEKQFVPYYNLGNNGSAYYPLMFQNENQIGFKHGFNSFDRYYYTPNSVKYYDTKTPYTYLDFVFGGTEEIIGGAEFAYNLKPNYNVAFNFHRNNFKGKSQHQVCFSNLFSLQQWFRTKNNFYDLKVSFIYNGIKNQENGGWNADDVFTDPIYKKRKGFVPIFLDDAVNKWSERNVNIYQQFRLGKKVETVINDSVTRKMVHPKYVIEHQFSFDHWKFSYKDSETDSLYYQSLLYDTDSTDDFTKTWTIRNGIYFKNLPNDSVPKKFLFSAGVQIDAIDYKHRFNHQTFADIQLKASIQNQQSDSSFFDYKVDATVDVAPSYIGDFSVNFLGRLNFKKNMSVGLLGEVSLATPSQKQTYYFGNHFSYHNRNLKKIFQAKIEAVYEWKKQLLYAHIQNYFIQNFIYNDTDRLPKQYNKPLNILVVKLRKEFNTKHIFVGTEIYVQWISNTNIIRLPVFAMKQTLYYKGGFISGKLNAQLGLDINYNTNFMGNAYNPALATFYNQDNQKLKFYPMLDLFFSLHVKRTNIFFRAIHVNQGMFKQKGIYTVPNYGYLDRTYRAGITWQFYD